MVRAFGRRECTPAERGHQQKQDDHQLSDILALAHLAEPFDHLVKRDTTAGLPGNC